MFTPWNAFTYSTGAFVFLFNWGALRFRIAISARTSPFTVSAGKSAEKGRKLVDNYEGIWDILE